MVMVMPFLLSILDASQNYAVLKARQIKPKKWEISRECKIHSCDLPFILEREFEPAHTASKMPLVIGNLLWNESSCSCKMSQYNQIYSF